MKPLKWRKKLFLRVKDEIKGINTSTVCEACDGSGLENWKSFLCSCVLCHGLGFRFTVKKNEAVKLEEVFDEIGKIAQEIHREYFISKIENMENEFLKRAKKG